MSIRHRNLGLAAAGVLLLSLAACRDGPPPPAEPRPNIVLFLPDTVRADAVTLDASGPRITPTLASLAAEGSVF